MQGVAVLNTMADAVAQGFHFFDIIEDGFLVRKMTPRGWALAIVRK